MICYLEDVALVYSMSKASHISIALLRASVLRFSLAEAESEMDVSLSMQVYISPM